MRPSPVPTTPRAEREGSPPGCWYAAATHRPTIGWCPAGCNGGATHSERAGNGDLLVYCEAHAYWRRKTAHLPLLRRL